MEGDGHLVGQQVPGVVLRARLKGKMKHSRLYLEAAARDGEQVLQGATDRAPKSKFMVKQMLCRKINKRDGKIQSHHFEVVRMREKGIC